MLKHAYIKKLGYFVVSRCNECKEQKHLGFEIDISLRRIAHINEKLNKQIKKHINKNVEILIFTKEETEQRNPTDIRMRTCTHCGYIQKLNPSHKSKIWDYSLKWRCTQCKK